MTRRFTPSIKVAGQRRRVPELSFVRSFSVFGRGYSMPMIVSSRFKDLAVFGMKKVVDPDADNSVGDDGADIEDGAVNFEGNCDNSESDGGIIDKDLRAFIAKRALKKITADQLDGADDMAAAVEEVDVVDVAEEVDAAAAEALAVVCKQRIEKVVHKCSNTGVSAKPIFLCEKRNARAVVVTLLDRSIKCGLNDLVLTSPRNAAANGLKYKWVRAKNLNPSKHSVWFGPWYPTHDGRSASDRRWVLDINSDFVNSNGLEFSYKLSLGSLSEMEKAMAFCRLLGMVNADGSIDSNKKRTRIFAGSAVDADAVQLDIFLLTGKYGTRTVYDQYGIINITLPRILTYAFCCLVGQSRGRRSVQATGWPDFIVDSNCPLILVRAFVSGFMSGDGIAPSLGHEELQSEKLFQRFKWPSIAIQCGHNHNSMMAKMTVLKHLLERCGLDGLSINHIQPEGQTDVYIILHKNGISEAWRAHASLTFVYCQHKQMRMEVVASYSRYKRTLMFQRRLTTYVMFQVLSHCTSGIRDRQICEIANVVIDHVLDNKQFDSDDEVFTTMFDFGLDGSGWSRVQAALRKPHMRLRVNRLVVQTLAARAALIDPSILGYTCEQANNMVRRQVDWTTMKCIGGMSATAFLRATRTARWFSDGCGNIIKMVNPNTKRPFTYATGRKCDVIPMFSVPVCGVYESMDDSVYYLQASSMCAVLQNGALIKSAEPSDSSGDTDDSNALIKCNQCDFATTVEFKFHTHYQVHQLEESPGLSYERQSRKQVTEEYAERKQIAASLNTLLPGPSLDGMKVEFTYEQALRFLRFARRNNCKVAEFDPNSIFAEQHPLSEQFLIKKLRELLFKPKETGRPESITTVLRKALKMVKRVQAHHRRITTLQSRIGESSQNKRRRVE